MPGDNIWNISKEGVEAIRDLSKNLDNSMEQMEQAFVSLNNTFVCGVDGLGIYTDSISATLNTMRKVNDESKTALEGLKQRLDKYASAIEAELAKQGDI